MGVETVSLSSTMWHRCRRWRDDLEDESGETEETSEASARESSGLAGTGSNGSGLGGAGGATGGLPRGSGSVGLGGPGGLGRRGGRGASMANHLGDDGDGLSDSARAVLDGESGSLSHGVGGAAIGDLSGLRAVGGDSGDDLGGVGHVAPSVGTSDGSKNGSSGELHFCGLFRGKYLLEKR